MTALAVALGVLACGDSKQTPAAPAKAPAVARDPRPNLLLVTLDTTRSDALGAYGQPRPTSPHIDRLAAEGVLFEQVTTSSPETLPSHATIMTGRWPFDHGVRANAGYVLPEQSLTLAEVLKSQGYRTGAEIAARVLRQETRITQGFDHYRGADSPGVKLKQVQYGDGEERVGIKPTRVGSDISARGIEFLRASRSRPFFLWLHYFDAHDPYSAPALFNDKIPDSRYHAEVASADFQLGLVIDELERLGLRDSTLVVVTADHGEGLGQHGEPSHSYFVYDTTMRVPLVLWGLPELPAGRRVESLVRSVDIAPTVLDLLRLPPLADADGVSLRPLISGAQSDLALTGYGEATRFAAAFGLPVLRFVREGRWKYLHKVSPELYDVVADPEETTNLAARHPDVVEQLRKKLVETLSQASGATGADAPIDAQTAAQLAALGYADVSPAASLRDELGSLDLWGDDPRERIGDTEPLSIATGLLERQEFAAALARIEPVFARNSDSPYVLKLMSMALMGLDRRDEAIPVLGRILELDPCDARAGDELAGIQREAKRYSELLALLARGAERCPEEPSRLNNYAWALATLPEPKLRDGRRAVEVIREAIGRLDAPDPAYLDTLGAALAEAGDFGEAERAASDALARLRAAGAPAAVLAEVEQHAASYRAGRPIRDPASASPGS